MPDLTIQQAFNVAVQHHQSGRLQEADQLYRQILAQEPNHADALHLLGVIAHQNGHSDVAVDLIARAIALIPDRPAFHCNIGEAHRAVGQLSRAIASYRQALALRPNYPGVYLNLGNTLKGTGQLDEAIITYRQALDLNPKFPDAHSCLLNALNVQPHFDPSAFANELRLWNSRHVEPLRQFIQPHPNDRSPNRPLKIAYLSPDFHMHSVAFFLLPLLEARDKEHFSITCYSTSNIADAVTDRLRTACDQWSSLVGLSDDQAAQRIRNDHIDILIDLSGHTAGNRLLLLARKPAPIQVTFLGYPGTTGMATIDYRLTDAFADPPGATDAFHTESLIRLPITAWCFTPLSGSPPIADLPALRNHFITFGSFNNLAKINPETLTCWSQLLQRIPTARLVLKCHPFCDPQIVALYRTRFASLGIDPARLDLLPTETSQLRHLQTYGRIDIALDTFPYHGTTTTCEALWMGVPVITRIGDRHPSRVGLSLLSNLGLPELAAHSEEQYLQIAVQLAQDLPRLADLRATLRPRMQASPLMNAPQSARHIEAACRRIWHTWCAASPDSPT